MSPKFFSMLRKCAYCWNLVKRQVSLGSHDLVLRNRFWTKELEMHFTLTLSQRLLSLYHVYSRPILLHSMVNSASAVLKCVIEEEASLLRHLVNRRANCSSQRNHSLRSLSSNRRLFVHCTPPRACLLIRWNSTRDYTSLQPMLCLTSKTSPRDQHCYIEWIGKQVCREGSRFWSIAFGEEEEDEFWICTGPLEAQRKKRRIETNDIPRMSATTGLDSMSVAPRLSRAVQKLERWALHQQRFLISSRFALTTLLTALFMITWYGQFYGTREIWAMCVESAHQFWKPLEFEDQQRVVAKKQCLCGWQQTQKWPEACTERSYVLANPFLCEIFLILLFEAVKGFRLL